MGPAPDGDMRRTAAKTAGGAEVLEMKGPGPFPIGEGPAKLRDHILPSLKGLPGNRAEGSARRSIPIPNRPIPNRADWLAAYGLAPDCSVGAGGVRSAI